MDHIHFSDTVDHSLAQPTRRPGMLSFKYYKFHLLTLKWPVDHHRREGFWYFEIQSTSPGRFVSVARPRNWYLPFYILFIFKHPNAYDPGGHDATEAFFSLHRYEILEKPQYQRLQIGVIDGEKPVIHGRIAGELSKVPYAEPTWLSPGYYSPYYSKVNTNWLPVRVERTLPCFSRNTGNSNRLFVISSMQLFMMTLWYGSFVTTFLRRLIRLIGSWSGWQTAIPKCHWQNEVGIYFKRTIIIY